MKHKKGVMPPALKAYWAKHRRGKKAVRARRTRKTMRNPLAIFRLAIQRGHGKHTRLYLASNGQKFSSSGPFKSFHDLTSIRAHAQHLARQYRGALKGYQLLAIPVGRYGS